MSDKTHLVDDALLLVPSLKQQALMKIAKTLIRPDLEKFCLMNYWVSYRASHRLSDIIEQLPISKSSQNDIRGTILGLYIHFYNGTIIMTSMTPSTVKYNARGDVDVRRTFDDYMEHICRWPHTPRRHLYQFLHNACRFHQEQCVHMMLCKLAKWTRSGLEPSLRNAIPEVQVSKSDEWRCSIRFVIEDIDDPAPWESFVTMLNDNFDNLTEFYLRENIIEVSTGPLETSFHVGLLWPKMTTIQKYEHATEIFKAALDRSDTCLLVQTMHYLDSTNRMHLIKANLVTFILCFLTHPYYRHFLPDLQLVKEDIGLLVVKDVLEVLEKLLTPLDAVGDYTNFSDCLVQLSNYFSSRDESLGKHVFTTISGFLHLYRGRLSDWFNHEDENNEDEKDDARKAYTKLGEFFGVKKSRIK